MNEPRYTHYSTMGKKILKYLNPLSQLGRRKYSVWFPLFFTALLYFFTEFFVFGGSGNTDGTYVIFLSLALIIYFAFRDGISGGLIATVITILYYMYLLLTREYSEETFVAGVQTSAALGMMYVILSIIIGWLKQTLDYLIEREKNARHEAEQGKLQLQTVLQQLPVGVLMFDKIEGKLNGNKQMEKILGSKIPKTFQKETPERPHFVYKSDRPLLEKEWPITRALTKGERVISEEMEFLRADKKKVFLRVNAAPIRNKEHEIIAAVSTLYDITHEKELEKRKNDFVNMASHELKTPITSLKLYVEMLARWSKHNKDEKFAKTIKSINNQADRLQELVNDLLDVTRIQTGKLHLQKDVFEMNEVITETIELLQPTTKDQTIQFKPQKPIMVVGDKFRIYQVLTNLLTNAIKYSPEKTSIIVKAVIKNKKVVVSVKDFGIGIEKDQQKKIFERLYQVTDITEKTFPGLGMGLYISKEIIKRHRGSIWVEGDRGKGSTFYFSLALAQ